MERLLQTFAIDPVAHPEGQVVDDTGIVDVANSRMIQPAECLRFAEKPRPDRGVVVEVYPQADPAFEDLIVGFEEDLVRSGGDRALQSIASPERGLSALKIAERLETGQRSSPRRRSILTSRPHTAMLHHRRLWLGESSVKNNEQLSPAQRRT
jgi:hypothetical protein